MTHELPIRPTPLIKPLPDAPEVPLADLGPLADPIDAIRTLTQAPTALALQAVLTAISVAAQPHANVETILHPVPLSLFAFSIAESSSRKSAVDALATAPIREFERPRLSIYAKALAAFDEAQKSSARRGDFDAVIENAYDGSNAKSNTPPISPKVLFDDITYQGLVSHFANGQPSIGILSDEGGKIIGGHAMNSQNQTATSSALSSFWDGREINHTRSSTGSITLADRRVSMHLAIQPMVAQSFMSSELVRDQGILSRVLVAMPDTLKGTRFLIEDEETLETKARAHATLDAYNECITELLEAEPRTNAFDPLGLDPRTLTLEPPVRALLIDFYNVTEEAQGDGGPFTNISGFAGKAAEHAARIAGNLALFSNAEAMSVDVGSMRTAISLVNFYLEEAVRIFDTGSVSKTVRDAEFLRQWIVELRDDMYVDLTLINKCGPNRLRSSPENKKLINILVEYGWLIGMTDIVEIDGRRSRRAFRVVRS
ncbi:YfjI family protein [Vannielia litorea]|uniref:DUF3987 domain-containing protein n=1 Tax=Vannielia litorea TaxID=1217970 RepID=A0A1N6GIH6_9RHOB|nr:YfjI family protein [Vannielia litorea]SIO07323.1 Protein of unknown function [Vannielia litorea]